MRRVYFKSKLLCRFKLEEFEKNLLRKFALLEKIELRDRLRDFWGKTLR